MLDITSFGGVGDNATDNSPALVAALAALPASGGAILFPEGKFRFNSAVAFTMPNRMFAVNIVGTGADATILYWPNANGGMSFTWTNQENSFHIRDLALTTGQADGGTALALLNSNFYGGYQQATQNDIVRVTFQGDTGVAPNRWWTNGVNVQAVNYVNFTGCLFYGGTATGVGVRLTDHPGVIVGGYNFTDSSFVNLHYCVHIVDDPQGPAFNNISFVDSNVGILVSGSREPLTNLAVSNCNFACYRYSIYLSSQASDVLINGNVFYNLDTAGIYAVVRLESVCRFTVANNIFVNPQPVNDAALWIANTHGWAGSVVGNVFSGPFPLAVYLTPQSSQVNVQSNSYSGVTTKVSNAGVNNTIGGGSL